MRVRVLLREPVGLLEYTVPERLASVVSPGIAVWVPLGPRQSIGYVVDVSDASSDDAPRAYALRAIHSVAAELPPISLALMQLMLQAARYYQTLPGELLAAALPPLGRGKKRQVRYQLTHETPTDPELFQALAARPLTLAQLARKLGAKQPELRARLQALCAEGAVTPVRGAHPVPSPTLDTTTAGAPLLTREQAVCVATLEAALHQGFATFALTGVTGSGKTEVYLRLVARCLESGESALVLVPEIALTPQLAAVFRSRFGDRVVVYHSALLDTDRQEAWERLSSSSGLVALGPRSAVFLPITRPGCIVVDEEHDASFKQEETPRYHGRDLAIWRGKLEGIPVVLGTATPSLESYANVRQGRYQSLRLSQRVFGNPLPQIEVVDLRKADLGLRLLSSTLRDALRETFRKGEQAILFLNRRGFAPYVYCHLCGYVYRCGACSVSLTLHRHARALRCHYCGQSQTVPDACDACGAFRLGSYGGGTEKLELEVRTLFGDGLGMVRLDGDTARHKQALSTGLDDFRTGKAQLLLGTQMVAKGHDFPNVTTVGVVWADASLNLPDFRAAERTFALLVQVSGRAGRGTLPGRVLVQSHQPEHYAIVAARDHDVEGFYARELKLRQELLYPPAAHLCLVRLEAEEKDAALDTAELYAKALRQDGLVVLGPAMAPLERLHGRYRVQVLVKSRSRKRLQEALAALPDNPDRRCRRIIDVDPVNMM